jgi:adenylate cyclase
MLRASALLMRLRIDNAVDAISVHLAAEIRGTLEAGLSLATGMVFTRVIGSVRRQEYTVLGDAVNIASRMERLTHNSAEKVLIDEATYNKVKDLFPCRKSFSGRLRGRTSSILIYGLNSNPEEPAP